MSFISTFWVLVAAIVVSDITDKLSPNIAPPTRDPITSVSGRFPLVATPTAIGPTAEIVPTEVPVEIEIKHPIKKIPAVIYWTGIKDRAKFTTESTPPEALDTVAKAPANMYIRHIIIMFSSPQPLTKSLNLSSIDPSNIINAKIIAGKIHTGAATW